MDGLILCNRQAKKPYYVEELDLNLYSIEEMAYYLYQNVYFADRNFFSPELIRYIAEELQMQKLSEQLAKAVNFGSSYAELVMLLVQSSGYYSEEEQSELSDILEQIGNKTLDERMAFRANLLMKKRKYEAANQIYQKILDRNRRIPDETKAKILYNVGVIYAKWFQYDRAAEYFEKSCDLIIEEETAEKLLLCYMLLKEKDKTVQAAKKYGISEEKTERIRLRMAEIKNQVQNARTYKTFSDSLIYDGSINLEEFYERMQHIIDRWKEEYREEMT